MRSRGWSATVRRPVRAAAARGLLRGGLDEGEVADAVRAHRADVVHAHNVHPLFGWRALAAARAAGARVVLHLHNYRLVCAIGVAYRDGEPCYPLPRRATRGPGVRHRCRGSLAERRRLRRRPRAPAAAPARRDRRARRGQRRARWRGSGRWGWSSSRRRVRVTVLPNAVERIAEESFAGQGKYALAAGRLVQEKGFDMAVRAAAAAGVPLRIAGEGPDEPALRALAQGADVRFLGRISQPELARERRGAALMLAPSRSRRFLPDERRRGACGRSAGARQRPRRPARAGRIRRGRARSTTPTPGRPRCATCGPTRPCAPPAAPPPSPARARTTAPASTTTA